MTIVRSDVGEQIAQRTAGAYRGLPQAQRDRTVVFGESYIVAAYLDGYSKRYQLPGAYCANRSYGYFPPPDADHDTVLYIGGDPGVLRSYFADVRAYGRRRRRGHPRVFADGTTAVVGSDVAAVAHLDGVLKPLRSACRAGKNRF